MPLFGATLEDAALFFTYNQVQHAFRKARGLPESAQLSVPDLAVAAGASGGMAGIVLTPVELIKCKMQVQMMGSTRDTPPAANAVRLISDTVKKEGFSGLWHGLSGTLVREVGGGIAWFLTFELSTREFLRLRESTSALPHQATKSDLTMFELATSGALAGVLYNVSLFPADSVKSAMQTEQELRAISGQAQRAPSGFWATAMRIYRTRGMRGLYAGVGVTCLRSAPSSGTFSFSNKSETN